MVMRCAMCRVRRQPASEMLGIATDALVRCIDPASPCAGLVGLGDQLVAINGYRIAYVRALMCAVRHTTVVTRVHGCLSWALTRSYPFSRIRAMLWLRCCWVHVDT